MNNFFSQISRFFVLITLQVLICNHIHLFGFLSPQLYVLALLLLPIELPRTVQYLIAFFTGLIVDLFLQTFGIHALACLLLVWLRPSFVFIISRARLQDAVFKPIPGVKDFNWLLLYTIGLVFLHQLIVTGVETFTWKEWFRIIWISIANTLFTTTIILAVEYIFISEKTKN